MKIHTPRAPLAVLCLAVFCLAVFCLALALGPDARSEPDERLSHWAYQPVKNVTPPASAGSHPVDRFVLQRLHAAGLAMSPSADRRTLIRRLSFDLHGLPPLPEEVERFIKDPDPLAYEKLVDRLLESPRYGERFARHWLDIAHYADTHGFERDRRRDHAWRYRDYVIRAFNEDKPYHRFLQEQIAGDVLWPDDEDAVVATGFLAAGPYDFVGQEETGSPVLRRSARALDLDDMTTQVMTATVAMTVNCARCHDHKLDPISQEEYYGLWSVFAGVKRGDRSIGEKAHRRLQAERARLTAEHRRVLQGIAELEGGGLDLADMVGGGDGTGSGKLGQGIDPRSAAVQANPLGRLPGVKINRFIKSDSPFIDGVFIPDGEGGKSKIPISSTGLTLTGLPATSKEAWDVIRNGPVASQHSNVLGGIDFTKDGHTLLGLHANAGITFDLAAIRKSAGWRGLRFTAQLGYFGMEGAFQADAMVLVDGSKVSEVRGLKRSDGLQSIDVPVAEGARFLTLVSSDGGNGISHDQVGFGNPRLKPDPLPALSAEDRGRVAALKLQRAKLEEDLRKLGAVPAQNRSPRVYAVVPRNEVPVIRVLERGDPESPVGEGVSPMALAALGMLDPALGSASSSEGERRVALAEWITDSNNPLTPRVIANRLWQWHFGRGLVATPSDFGLGGGEPSHPELLDWLAGQLSRRNWSLKALHRILLTSAAYKQSSRYTTDAKGVAIDAGNRLLWRQNVRRIEAEAIRDSVLAVSGKLNLEMGGPGFEDFRYQDAYAPIYTYVTADKPTLWRRSIYRYIVRTSPDPFMTTLDCPDPANLTPTRMTTTTPLQSLALYNNDFMLRQARYFAERIEKEAGKEVNAQVRQGFALALGRAPTKEEEELAVDFVRGESLFAFCRSLLNANEFVYVD